MHCPHKARGMLQQFHLKTFKKLFLYIVSSYLLPQPAAKPGITPPMTPANVDKKIMLLENSPQVNCSEDLSKMSYILSSHSTHIRVTFWVI